MSTTSGFGSNITTTNTSGLSFASTLNTHSTATSPRRKPSSSLITNYLDYNDVLPNCESGTISRSDNSSNHYLSIEQSQQNNYFGTIFKSFLSDFPNSYENISPTGSTLFPNTSEVAHFSYERDYKSYPDYSYSYSQPPLDEYIPNISDEPIYRNSRISQDRRHRRRLSNYSQQSNVNRTVDQFTELDSGRLYELRNSLISPTRNRHDFQTKIPLSPSTRSYQRSQSIQPELFTVERNDELRSSFRSYSKSLAGTPTNSRLPMSNMMSREDFNCYANRVSRSQSSNQSRHRRFNSASNSFRYYNESASSQGNNSHGYS